MKKILYVTDALNLNLDNLDFAAYICKLTSSKLTAIFLENNEAEMRTDNMIRHAAVQAGLDMTEEIVTLKTHCCEMNIERFKSACESRKLAYSVHRDMGNPLGEVTMESRYADLILLSVSTTFSPEEEAAPTSFARDVLCSAECPVIVMPQIFEGIRELVFTYDGKSSSIHAIKEFTNLFPQFYDYKSVVLTVNPEEVDPEERYRFMEWMHAHYSNVDYLTSDGNVKLGLVEMLYDRTKTLVIMGAYGRSMVSNFFIPSHATPVLKLITQAVFIAHV